MFLAGRVLAGFAVGGMVGTVPIYLSEIAAPNHRGLIAGVSGCGISFGTMMSNWIGFACSYAPYGPIQWRLPLGIQSKHTDGQNPTPSPRQRVVSCRDRLR